MISKARGRQHDGNVALVVDNEVELDGEAKRVSITGMRAHSKSQVDARTA